MRQWFDRASLAQRAALAAFSVALLLACVVLAVVIGEIRISPLVAWQTVLKRLGWAHYDLPAIQEGVIWNYRLSRALVAACCGAGLALCGVILQSLLRNPLAEPYILGVSAGASTGAVLVIVLGLGTASIGLSGGAFLGALAAFGMVGFLASKVGGAGNTDRIILAGVACAQLFNALTSYIVTSSANAEQMRSVMFWLLGDMGGVRWPDFHLLLAISLAGLALAMYFARTMDALIFGEDAASALGISVQRVRLILFGATALITAAIVSVVGAVGFVGLVIPHIARFLLGPLHARLIPAAFMMGAIFMVCADIASRTLVQHQILPIGVVTALVGAPVFAFILYKARK